MTLLLSRRANIGRANDSGLLALVCVHCRAEVAVSRSIAADLAVALDRVHRCLPLWDEREMPETIPGLVP